MRGYGLPRNSDIQWPDMADLRTYGLKQGHGWDWKRWGYKPYKIRYPRPALRQAKHRKEMRRIWKRAARVGGKRAILLALSGKVW